MRARRRKPGTPAFGSTGAEFLLVAAHARRRAAPPLALLPLLGPAAAVVLLPASPGLLRAADDCGREDEPSCALPECATPFCAPLSVDEAFVSFSAVGAREAALCGEGVSWAPRADRSPAAALPEVAAAPGPGYSGSSLRRVRRPAGVSSSSLSSCTSPSSSATSLPLSRFLPLPLPSLPAAPPLPESGAASAASSASAAPALAGAARFLPFGSAPTAAGCTARGFARLSGSAAAESLRKAEPSGRAGDDAGAA